MGFSAARLSLPVLMVSAFFVSLITVALPNPITLVASKLAISRRFGHAVWFLTGVTVMDIALFAMLAGGAAPLLARIGAMPAVELMGGCGLLVAGSLSLRRRRTTSSRRSTLPATPGTAGKSFLLGVAVCAGNPHYWIWWVTAGLAFVEAARSHGPLGLSVMLAALIGGVVSWYIPLLWALHHGRKLLSPRAEHRIEAALGILLLVLGVGLIALGAYRLL